MILSLSPGILAALIGTPLLIALGQVLFKVTSTTVGSLSIKSLTGLLLNPAFLSAITLYVLGTFIWIFVLKHVPLTIAYSFMGLTFLFVPVLAIYFLDETLNLRYVLGASLIMVGLVVINV